MRRYYEMLGKDPFEVLPLTFHMKDGVNDPDYRVFKDYYDRLEKQINAKEREKNIAVKAYLSKRRKQAQSSICTDFQDEDSHEDSEEEREVEAIKLKFRTPLNTWIVKPGENTNRGNGISVVKDIRDVNSLINSRYREERTYIIQKYIDYPLLVHKRKFDFRCFGMLTSVGGSLKGYAYSDGYVRTSCRPYCLDDVTDQYVHLTNDAI